MFGRSLGNAHCFFDKRGCRGGIVLNIGFFGWIAGHVLKVVETFFSRRAVGLQCFDCVLSCLRMRIAPRHGRERGYRRRLVHA